MASSVLFPNEYRNELQVPSGPTRLEFGGLLLAQELAWIGRCSHATYTYHSDN